MTGQAQRDAEDAERREDDFEYWQAEALAAQSKLDRIAALRVEDYGDPYWVFRDLRQILEIDA